MGGCPNPPSFRFSPPGIEGRPGLVPYLNGPPSPMPSSSDSRPKWEYKLGPSSRDRPRSARTTPPFPAAARWCSTTPRLPSTATRWATSSQAAHGPGRISAGTPIPAPAPWPSFLEEGGGQAATNRDRAQASKQDRRRGKRWEEVSLVALHLRANTRRATTAMTKSSRNQSTTLLGSRAGVKGTIPGASGPDPHYRDGRDLAV